MWRCGDVRRTLLKGEKERKKKDICCNNNKELLNFA
jgi:hypothetical protein